SQLAARAHAPRPRRRPGDGKAVGAGAVSGHQLAGRRPEKLELGQERGRVRPGVLLHDLVDDVEVVAERSGRQGYAAVLLANLTQLFGAPKRPRGRFRPPVLAGRRQTGWDRLGRRDGREPDPQIAVQAVLQTGVEVVRPDEVLAVDKGGRLEDVVKPVNE